MKVVLTGASGFLGRHTYNDLLKTGHDIVSIDNRSVGIGKEIIIDLATTGSYELTNICKGADAIIHLASVVDFSVSIKKKMWLTKLLKHKTLGYLINY